MEGAIWKIEWDDALSFGNPEIDDEHKQFIALVSALNDSVVGRMEISEIKKKLQDIVDFVGPHFAHEEQLFKEVAYQDTDEHSLKHAQLVEMLQHSMKDANANNTDYQWIETGLKIKEEIINHVLQDDMKYADYYHDSYQD